MQIFRDGPTISPVGELYGKKQMPTGQTLLVASLDIVVMQVVNNTPKFRPPTIPGILNGASITSTADGPIGKIFSYDFPPTVILNVKPFILIDPLNNFDLSGIEDIERESVPAVSKDQPVDLVLAPGLTVSGVMAMAGTVSRNYPSASSQVNAFRVNFDQHLLGDVHGAKVHVGGSLLGMLIATQNQLDGSCHTLVFPADQV
jgi:hypothetical protein